MAAVSPIPQSAALNLSLKGRDARPDHYHHQAPPPPPCRTGRPVQRVQPTDFNRLEERRSPPAEPGSPGNGPPALVPVMAAAESVKPAFDSAAAAADPEPVKDGRYWDRRRRNNDAAKRSRQRRRFADVVLEAHMLQLARENDSLKAELMEMRERADRSTSGRANPCTTPTVLVQLPPAPGRLFYDPDSPASHRQPEAANYPGAFPFAARPGGSPPGGDRQPRLLLKASPSPPPPRSASGSPAGAWPVVPADHLRAAALHPWPLDGVHRGEPRSVIVPGPKHRSVLDRDGQGDGGSATRLARTVVLPSPSVVTAEGSSSSGDSTATSPRDLRAGGGQPLLALPPLGGRDKPPSPPHSAFAPGLQLSKLPHKLREKMKRAAASIDGPPSDDSPPPPIKVLVRRVTPEEDGTSSVPEDEGDPRSVFCPASGLDDPSFTPPPSSGSSSDGNASPLRPAALFDFPVKAEPSLAGAMDATLAETHERMVRAAHALAALNKTSSASESAGGRSSSPAGASPLDDREKYWDKRRRNNQAAKKCRDAKRLLIDYRAARSAYLEQENSQLRCETAVLQQEVARLKELVQERVDAENRDNKPTSKSSLAEPPGHRLTSPAQACP